MTKQKKHLYKIMYKDDTYLIVDWSNSEFDKVCKAKIEGNAAVATKETLVDLTTVRTIVFIPPIPEPTEEERKEYNSKMKTKTKRMMEEYGFVDQETMNWLEEQGIMDLQELEGDDE